MAQKDFSTQYKAGYSSGGALQNNIIPPHIDNIIMLLDGLTLDPNGIEALKNKIRTQFIVHKQGFKKPETIKKKLEEINIKINEWRTKKNLYPTKLVDMMYELAEDFFFQWNESGAGLIFIAHDANRDKKIYDAIVGNK